MDRRCTNLTDRTGRMVFEGDLLIWTNGEIGFTAIVEICTDEEDLKEADFWIRSSSGGGGFVNKKYMKNFEVIS